MQGQTSTTGDYPALDLSLYNVVALEALNTGDVYLDDQGYPVTVIRRDGDHAFVREEGSDWLLEVEMDEQLVKVTARATFALVSWAAQYIDGREWRVCVGE